MSGGLRQMRAPSARGTYDSDCARATVCLRSTPVLAFLLPLPPLSLSPTSHDVPRDGVLRALCASALSRQRRRTATSPPRLPARAVLGPVPRSAYEGGS